MSPEENKRVCLLLDTQTHMMPALAKEMANRGHNLVIGNVKDGLPDELEKLGAQVEVVPGNLDMTKPDGGCSAETLWQNRFLLYTNRLSRHRRYHGNHHRCGAETVRR